MSTNTKNCITLKGSSKIVSDFFYYGINSILYQRGIYPADDFHQEKQYGVTVVVANDNELQEYLTTILTQIKNWLEECKLHRLVLVIKNLRTMETVERWQFNIESDKESAMGDKPVHKPAEDIKKEVVAVIRQIVASVSLLPVLQDKCAFDLLAYTGNDIDTPAGWGTSGPHFIADSEEVKLKSFSTMLHKVDTVVTYKKE